MPLDGSSTPVLPGSQDPHRSHGRPPAPGPWIDSHCHLDAPEFDGDRAEVLARARAAGVGRLVLPAVRVRDFDTVRALAHEHGLAYALGLHPLYLHGATEGTEGDLDRLAQALQRHAADPHLVAVGEIGLDHFVAAHDPRFDRQRQERLYLAQLRLARAAGLPVILHVRRSADALLAGLNRIAVPGGIAHAFNGSEQQARRFAERGFKLGFGGAMTFERALQIRALAAALPAEVPVLETDAPDIPPWWLYAKAGERASGAPQGRNEPAELPRIAQALAQLRGWSLEETAAHTTANVLAALPRLAVLWPGPDEGGLL
jgi:TatD DNase family protein